MTVNGGQWGRWMTGQATIGAYKVTQAIPNEGIYILVPGISLLVHGTEFVGYSTQFLMESLAQVGIFLHNSFTGSIFKQA